MAGIVIDSAVLGWMIAVIVRSFFPVVERRRHFVGDAVEACVIQMDVFCALSTQALQAILANRPVGILGRAMVVAYILAELKLIVTAH